MRSGVLILISIIVLTLAVESIPNREKIKTKPPKIQKPQKIVSNTTKVESKASENSPGLNVETSKTKENVTGTNEEDASKDQIIPNANTEENFNEVHLHNEEINSELSKSNENPTTEIVQENQAVNNEKREEILETPEKNEHESLDSAVVQEINHESVNEIQEHSSETEIQPESQGIDQITAESDEGIVEKNLSGVRNSEIVQELNEESIISNENEIIENEVPEEIIQNPRQNSDSEFEKPTESTEAINDPLETVNNQHTEQAEEEHEITEYENQESKELNVSEEEENQEKRPDETSNHEINKQEPKVEPLKIESTPEVLDHDTQKPENLYYSSQTLKKHDLNPSDFSILSYLIYLPEQLESFIIKTYQQTITDEKSRLIFFYGTLIFFIWLLTPGKRKISYNTSFSEESSESALKKVIEDDYNKMIALIEKKEPKDKKEDSDSLTLHRILKGLEEIKELEAEFQSQVIDSHKEIWEALEYRRTPLSPPQEIKIPVPIN